MLSSICSRRRFILASVKFLSRLFTALNLLPSIATLASPRRSRRRHSRTNARQTLRIASPLSLRKSAMVLKSGIKCPVNQLDIALALPLKPSARLDAIEISVNVDLQQRRRVISRPACCKGRDAVKAEIGEIQPIDKGIDRPHRIVLAHILIQHCRKQRALPAIPPLNKALHPIPPQIARNHSARINLDRALLHSLDPKET